MLSPGAVQVAPPPLRLRPQVSDLVVYSEGMSGWNERSDGGMMNALLWSKSAAGREAVEIGPVHGR